MRLLLALSINIALVGLFFLYFSHALVATLLTVSLFVWFFYFLWRRQNAVLERIQKKSGGERIILPIEHIRFRAVESAGYSQADGMGYIVLTEEHLHFELILMDLVISVPTFRLRGAEFVRRLKGVSPARQMLRILYLDEKGNKDSIAINVEDMELWKNTILDIVKADSQ